MSHLFFGSGIVEDPMLEALEIKRESELLSERLGKTQDYL